jgi:hypothetical protein
MLQQYFAYSLSAAPCAHQVGRSFHLPIWSIDKWKATPVGQFLKLCVIWKTLYNSPLGAVLGHTLIVLDCQIHFLKVSSFCFFSHGRRSCNKQSKIGKAGRPVLTLGQFKARTVPMTVFSGRIIHFARLFSSQSSFQAPILMYPTFPWALSRPGS